MLKTLSSFLTYLRIIASAVWFFGYIFSTQAYYVDVWLKTPYIDGIHTSDIEVLNHVKSLQNYGYDRTQRDSFNFSVKVKSRATLFLFQTNIVSPDNDFYMLQIGRSGNTEVAILYRENKDAAVETRKFLVLPGLVNELEYRPFWIDLGENRIRLGRGTTINIDTLIEWEDSLFDTKSVAIFAIKRDGFWILTFDAHFTGYYSACHARNIRGDMVLINSMKSINKWQCTGECSQMNNCLGFNYHAVDKSCELIRTEQYVFVEKEAEGWIFYRKCLQYSKGCLCD